MDDTSKKTNLFGEVLKANLASDFIKAGIDKIVDGFKKLKDSIVSYVNTGIELSNAETENRQKLLQVMQNTMDARIEDAESIDALISKRKKLARVAHGLAEIQGLVCSKHSNPLFLILLYRQ